YIIPTTVIQHFMKDLEDGRLDGVPAMCIFLQNLESPDLKKCYRVPPEKHGMLVKRVVRGGGSEGVLRVGDVITRLDDYDVADDGTVELRPGERTSCKLVAQGHQVGETMKVQFIRDGQPQSCQLKLTNLIGQDVLVPDDRYDVLPTYYIFGGLVFCPLTLNLIKGWGDNWSRDAPADFMTLMNHREKSDIGDEAVVLLNVLPSAVNQGYQQIANLVLKKVNGREIHNLRELVSIIESSRDQFVRIEDAWGQVIVLDRERCLAEQPEILRTYQIGRDRSEDLLAVPKMTVKAK
ncbi:MAG: hypothetical protein WCG36_10685, partial [bacterium]